MTFIQEYFKLVVERGVAAAVLTVDRCYRVGKQTMSPSRRWKWRQYVRARGWPALTEGCHAQPPARK